MASAETSTTPPQFQQDDSSQTAEQNQNKANSDSDQQHKKDETSGTTNDKTDNGKDSSASPSDTGQNPPTRSVPGAIAQSKDDATDSLLWDVSPDGNGADGKPVYVLNIRGATGSYGNLTFRGDNGATPIWPWDRNDSYTPTDADKNLHCGASGLITDSSRPGSPPVSEVRGLICDTDGGLVPTTNDYRARIDRVSISDSGNFPELTGGPKPLSAASMFKDMPLLTSITGLKNLNPAHISDMHSMFESDTGFDSIISSAHSLSEEDKESAPIDFTGFDSSNVSNMGKTFKGMTGLTKVDLSALNTKSVTTMSSMFSGVTNLPSLDVSGFNENGSTTGKVLDTGQMFYNDSGLTSLTLGNFNTNSIGAGTSCITSTGDVAVISGSSCEALGMEAYPNPSPDDFGNMSSMFDGCSKLETIDVSSFNENGSTTAHVPSTGLMFAHTSSLTSIIFGNFNTSSVTSMSGMFKETNLSTLDISSFNENGSTTAKVQNMGDMFKKAENLSSLNLGKFNTSGAIVMTSMFDSDYGFHGTFDVSCFNENGSTTKNVVEMGQMFSSMNWITGLNLGNFDTSSVKSMYLMFNAINNVTTLDVSSFNTSNVTDMTKMFNYDQALTGLDVSGFNKNGSTTKNVQHAEYMFAAMPNLKSLTLNNFDTSGIGTDTKHPANGSGSTIPADNPDGSADGHDGPSGDVDTEGPRTLGPGSMQAMFQGDEVLSALDLSSFDTSNVMDMHNMFQGDTALTHKSDDPATDFDVSNFDTGKVTDMSNMFQGDTGLTNLNLSRFDTGKVTNMSGMFQGDAGLTNLNLSNFNTVSVTNMDNMFNGAPKLQNIILSASARAPQSASANGTFDTAGLTGDGEWVEISPNKNAWHNGSFAEMFENAPRTSPTTYEFRMHRTIDYNPNSPASTHESHVIDDTGNVNGTMESVTTFQGFDFTVPSPTYTCTYYKFTGWNTASDGSGTAYQPDAVIDTSYNGSNTSSDGANDHIVLYAQWKIIIPPTATLPFTGVSAILPTLVGGVLITALLVVLALLLHERKEAMRR